MIHLDGAIFKKTGKAGVLKAKFFDTGKKADSKKDRVLYDETSGWVRYDKDGSKNKHDPAKVAKLLIDDKPVEGLSSGDFLVI